MKFSPRWRHFALAALAYATGVNATTITVTSVADGIATGVGCTLRAAIEAANTDTAVGDCPAGSGGDVIAFNIAGAGVHTILPATPLPSVTQSLTIDGYSQPGSAPNTLPAGQGSNAQLRIEIDAANIGNAAALSVVGPAANVTTIRGLAITSSGAAVCCAQRGILLSNVSFVWIQGNFIGIAPDGVTAKGLGAGGVFLSTPTRQVTIGSDAFVPTPLAAEMNVISGNRGPGIQGNGSTANLWIRGNLLGTNAAGVAAVPNVGAGIQMSGILAGNAMWNDNLITHNTISGNLGGVALSESRQIDFSFNRIGVAADGVSPLPNTGRGLDIGDNPFSSPSTTTTVRVANNTIANNTGGGLLIYRANAANTVNGMRLVANALYNNTGYNLDLSATSTSDGPTMNDAGDSDQGANALQNAPNISAVTANGSTLSITWNLATNPSAATFIADFFHSPTCVAGAPVAARTFINSSQITTNAQGNYTGMPTFASTLTNGFVVATVTADSSGNSSELSNCFPITSLVQQAVASPAVPVPTTNASFAQVILSLLIGVSALASRQDRDRSALR